MNLTFKRGSKSDLDNIDITPNMIYFTTDLNSHNIYMDSNDGKRNKIFGFNDDDIITSTDDISYNTFFGSNFNGILLNNQVAIDGNTTNKQAIGVGYYNNVIGEDIQNILYKQSPTITSSITYLQNNARSKLTPLWLNESPDTTWSEDWSNEWSEGIGVDTDENFDINLSEVYLGYVILVQSCLSDTQTIYPASVFGLPQSIIGDNKCYRSYSITMENSSHYVATAKLTFTLDDTNNILNIRKESWGNYSGDSGESSFPFHEFLIPIAVYGWRL